MNFRQRILLLVFHTRSVLIGYSRRIESNKRHICSSLQTKGRWMFGSQNPPSSSGLFRKLTIFLRECLGVFIVQSSCSRAFLPHRESPQLGTGRLFGPKSSSQVHSQSDR